MQGSKRNEDRQEDLGQQFEYLKASCNPEHKVKQMRSVGRLRNITIRRKWKWIVNRIAFASRKIQRARTKSSIEKADNKKQMINHLGKTRILPCHPPDLRAQSKNKRFPQDP